MQDKNAIIQRLVKMGDRTRWEDYPLLQKPVSQTEALEKLSTVTALIEGTFRIHRITRVNCTIQRCEHVGCAIGLH